MMKQKNLEGVMNVRITGNLVVKAVLALAMAVMPELLSLQGCQ